MIARTHQTRSRLPRRPNETFRAMASVPAGFTSPQERKRVSILVHENTVDFDDPLLSVSETPTSQTMKSFNCSSTGTNTTYSDCSTTSLTKY